MAADREEVGSRQEVPSPKELWASDDGALWSAVRAQYLDAVAAAATRGKGKAALQELDRWYRTELQVALGAAVPSAAAARRDDPRAGRSTEEGGNEGEDQQPHITRGQLERLVEWKMARGQWRPRLLAFARDQPAGAVESASAKALAALRGYQPPASGAAEAEAGAGPSGGGGQSGAGCGPGSAPGSGAIGAPDATLRTAVEALTALKGVGGWPAGDGPAGITHGRASPATASALLSAANPTVPYMGDEALAVCLPPGRQSDYSLKAFLELAAQLQAKARRLQQGRKEATPPAAPEGAPGPSERTQGGAPSPVGEAAAAAAAGRSDDAPASVAAEEVGSGRQRPRPAAGPGPAAANMEGDWAAADLERCLWAAAVLYGSRRGAGGAGAVAGVRDQGEGEGKGKGAAGGKGGAGKGGRGAKRAKR